MSLPLNLAVAVAVAAGVPGRGCQRPLASDEVFNLEPNIDHSTPQRQ